MRTYEQERDIARHVDMFATCDHASELMDYFKTLLIVDNIIAKDDTKSTVRLKNNINMDLRVLRIRSTLKYCINYRQQRA